MAGPNSSAEVWVRDVVAGRTWLASRADGGDGAPAAGASRNPALDADGSHVAFDSTAANLGDGDADAVRDVHVRDLEGGRTVLASRADGPIGAKGNAASFAPDISADGSRVAFISAAANLGDGDADSQDDVHVRDLAAATTSLASADPGGAKANRPSIAPVSLDASGTRVAFASAATNLLGLTAPIPKGFVRDLAAGTLTLASRADGIDAAPAEGAALSPRLSPDGRYVVFGADAGNLAPGLPTGVARIYRRDLATGRTELVSRRGGPAGAPLTASAGAGDISAGGGCVTFSTSEALFGPPNDYLQAYLRALRADCAARDDGEGGGEGGGERPPEPGPGAGDRVAPVLAAARLTRTRFRVGRAATPRAALSPPRGTAPRGTVLRFRSSEAGTLAVAIERAAVGRRAKGGRCRPAPRAPRRRACTAYRRAGTLKRGIAAGAGRVALSGRIGRRALKAGRYRLTLVARDVAGNRSAPVRLRFAILRG